MNDDVAKFVKGLNIYGDFHEKSVRQAISLISRKILSLTEMGYLGYNNVVVLL